METAVAIVFFNRLEPLKKLVARLAEVRPPRVYLISDGPRANRVGEGRLVETCREFMRSLPWNCEVLENFAETNMGCRKRVTSGLDWVFEREDKVIILEDDCVPEPEFFPWAENMLERYKDEPKVLSVGGTNLCPHLCDQTKDCAFTKYAMIWGWATWRRAWRRNDWDLQLLQRVCDEHHLKKWLGKWRAEWYWRYLLKHVESSWGYRWIFTHFANSCYCVLPPVNLVNNIGMSDAEATHTLSNPYDLAKVAERWRVPDGRFDGVSPNKALDSWVEDHFYSRSLGARLKWGIRKLFGR